MFNKDPRGQSLIELVVVVAVIVIVIGALTFATIASLRNANFAKSQAQATKLAQEGLEKVRSLRDRDDPVDYVKADLTHTNKFSDLWGITFSCPSNCYFYFIIGTLVSGNGFEAVSTDFKRQILIEEEGSDPAKQKKVTVRVVWTDFAGDHESRLTTVLRRI